MSVNVRLSANLRVPAYLVSAKGTFDNVKILLDNLTNKNLIPYFYYAPPDLMDKILNKSWTGTTKLMSDYYKTILKEKWYGVIKSDLWLAGNYQIVKKENEK